MWNPMRWIKRKLFGSRDDRIAELESKRAAAEAAFADVSGLLMDCRYNKEKAEKIALYFQIRAEELLKDYFASKNEFGRYGGRKIEVLIHNLARDQPFVAFATPGEFELVKQESVRVNYLTYRIGIAMREQVPPELIADRMASEIRSQILAIYRGQSVLTL